MKKCRRYAGISSRVGAVVAIARDPKKQKKTKARHREQFFFKKPHSAAEFLAGEHFRPKVPLVEKRMSRNTVQFYSSWG